MEHIDEIYENLQPLDLTKDRIANICDLFASRIYESGDKESKTELSDMLLTLNYCMKGLIRELESQISHVWDSFWAMRRDENGREA